MAPTAQRGTIKPGTDENVVKLDFRNVGERKEGGKAAHVPPGDYLLEVASVKNVPVANGANKGKRQLAWIFRIVGVSAANDTEEARSGIGDTVYLNTMVEWTDPKKQGWFLRNLIEDLLEAQVTGAALNLKLDDKAGKRLGVTLVDGEPWGDDQTVRSEIKYTFPASRFIPAGGAAPAAAAAPSAKAESNGVSTAEEATEAVEAATEDEDIEELPVQSL